MGIRFANLLEMPLIGSPATAASNFVNLFFGTDERLYKKNSAGVQTLIEAPIGSVMNYAGTTEPTGWIFCDGRDVASSYPALAAVLGTTYNLGTDGGAVRRIPDTSRRTVRGAHSASSFPAGNSDGELTVGNRNTSHTHPITQSATHNHTINSGGAHQHAAGSLASAVVQRTGTTSANTAQNPITGSVASDGAHDHGASTGGDGAHDHGGNTSNPNTPAGANNWFPYVAMNMIIKT